MYMYALKKYKLKIMKVVKILIKFEIPAIVFVIIAKQKMKLRKQSNKN